MVSWSRRTDANHRDAKRFRVEGMTAAQLRAKVGVSAHTVWFYMAERVFLPELASARVHETSGGGLRQRCRTAARRL